MPDYYEVLQVHPRAEPEVIRAAYRTLARKYHPDLDGGDADRMIALNDAWDVLGDPVRRAAYDAARRNATGSMGIASTAAGTPAPARPADRPAATRATGAGASEVPHAGPPPGRPSGTVLDFGRYAGWSLGEIARFDLDYLEWLQRATFGRRLRSEIDAILRQRRGAAGGSPGGATTQSRWGIRR
jgi:curved DNA-binding protein CbpA